MSVISPNLAPLSTALPVGAPPADLVFHAGVGPTLPELRDPRSGACFNGPAQAHVRDALAQLDQSLCELTLGWTNGRLEPRAEPAPTLDTLQVTKTILKIEAACTVHPELLGRRVCLVLECIQRDRRIEPSVDVHLVDREGANACTKAARNDLQRIAGDIFLPCAILNLGPWMQASGLVNLEMDAVLDLPLVRGAPPEPAMT